MTAPRPPSHAEPLLLGRHWFEDDPGGLNRYLADLFGALRSVGLHPTAVVAGPAAAAPVGVVASGHHSRPFPIRLTSYAHTVRRTAAAGVGVVDAHFAFYAFWPAVFGGLRRVPLVVHFQGPWAQESRAAGEPAGWRIAAKHSVEAAVYRRAREVVVLSDAFKQVIVEGYGVPPWRVSVVPPGVDLHRFTPADRVVTRSELGLPPDAPVAVAVRRLVPRMGLDVLLDAWAAVEQAVPEAVLLLVGDGPERASLQRRAGRSAITRSVRFLGRVPDATLVRCYQAADVSVVPTLALEGFGLVVLESLACGTPAVVTDSTGLPDSVTPLDPSLVVPAGDAVALARRLVGVLDGTQPAPGRDRCRTHAESYSWAAVAERHRVIYERAVHPHGRRVRVVFVDHCARLSGGELAMLRLLPALDVDAHVILGEQGPLVDKLRAAGVSVEVLAIADTAGWLGRDRVQPGRLPISALTTTGTYVARLTRRLRQLTPDLVHTNSLKSALYGGAAARLASIPAVWHVRDRITDDYMPASACRMVKAAARILPTAVIANSRATLATLGRAGVGGAVIASPLGSSPAESARPSTAGPLRVGMVGRLDPWKGQHVFLDAFAKAFPSGREEAVIVGASLFGDNGYERQLQRQAADLGIAGRVDFRGFRDRMEDELDRLDVLVHASTIPEPFGQVVVEGMAVGLAVVAADAGGPAEVIEDGVNGMLCPPGDTGAMAAALQRLAADSALRHGLGEAARARAENFTPARIAPQVMDVYERTLANRRAPAGRGLR
ncbi:MAG: glycosyltransferase family 4 protein [Acidimicrobiales bacterium]